MEAVVSIDFWKVPRDDVQILDEIGTGGWGVVAKGTFRGQEVAVKRPHRMILNARNIDRLRREVRIMAQVRHPNLLLFIAAVFDEQVDRLEEPPLIVSELLEMNLRSAYEKGRLECSSKLLIFRDVACALNYLHQHQQHIVHRDVSAPNVLLEALPNNKWRAKLSDFGSANLEEVACTPGEGAIIYTAPEAFPVDIHAVVPPQTTKIDVYSYGVLLCEVITNQLPVRDDYRSMLQQVQRQWLFMYNLIISCTKRKPEERPTMAGVLSELNKLPQPQPSHHSSQEVTTLKCENTQLEREKQQLQTQLQHERDQATHAEQTLREQLQDERDQATHREQTLRQLQHEREQATHTEQTLREQLQQEREQATHTEQTLREQLQQEREQATHRADTEGAASAGEGTSHTQN